MKTPTKPTIRQRKEALTRLISAGAQMSNLCFNVAQTTDHGVRADIPETAYSCRIEWDNARKSWRDVCGGYPA